MNPNQWTQSAVKAINGAHELAQNSGHGVIDQTHLLMALIEDSRGLICQLIERLGGKPASLRADMDHELS